MDFYGITNWNTYQLNEMLKMSRNILPDPGADPGGGPGPPPDHQK